MGWKRTNFLPFFSFFPFFYLQLATRFSNGRLKEGNEDPRSEPRETSNHEGRRWSLQRNRIIQFTTAMGVVTEGGGGRPVSLAWHYLTSVRLIGTNGSAATLDTLRRHHPCHDYSIKYLGIFVTGSRKGKSRLVFYALDESAIRHASRSVSGSNFREISLLQICFIHRYSFFTSFFLLKRIFHFPSIRYTIIFFFFLREYLFGEFFIFQG